eukprot:CAMPEP_0174707058 /NCGR_PEP_ID=MMETSP1094-20130205/9687_1 /TAXON_ID=156173 /ORGANISM="Chrysochromulina brevifilum, Strain UTEX LB 985" /LENGTH=71 /DNA_ID=CAMNT_0015905393 /DNA_START=334 /DNA_END=549 /DNA_ORIENTATION=-
MVQHCASQSERASSTALDDEAETLRRFDDDPLASSLSSRIVAAASICGKNASIITSIGSALRALWQSKSAD